MDRRIKHAPWLVLFLSTICIGCGDGSTDGQTDPSDIGMESGVAPDSGSDATSNSNTDPSTDTTSGSNGDPSIDVTSGPGTDVDPDPGASSAGTKTDTGPTCTEGTEGLLAGNLLPDVTLQTCEGEDVSMRSLVCGNRFNLIFSYMGWCNSCKGFVANRANPDYEKYHPYGYEQFIVYRENADGSKPSLEDCAAMQSKINGGTVLIDPQNNIRAYKLIRNSGAALVDENGILFMPTENVKQWQTKEYIEANLLN